MAANLRKVIIGTKMNEMLRKTNSRASSTVKLNLKERHKMSAWQIHSYGGLEELKFSPSARIPYISNPDEVLVKVNATSVNPLDLAMIKGYGATLLNFARTNESVEFPLTMGRDFAGTVEWKGQSVGDDLPLGSKVWGVIPPYRQGCHAEYVVVDKNWLGRQPDVLSTSEASSILYAGLTAWSGLMFSAGFILGGMRGARVLVLGAAGGVGNMAVQILRAGHAYVTCSCSTDAIPLVQKLGADVILDRNDPDYEKCLKKYGPFDVVLDCAGLGSRYAVEKSIDFQKYVTFTSPLLANADNYGLVGGMLNTAFNLICPNVRAVGQGRTVRWAYFVPSSDGIAYLHQLVQTMKGQYCRLNAVEMRSLRNICGRTLTDRLNPVIDSEYKYEDLPEAYRRVANGHLRGKVVIKLDTDK